MMWLRIVSTAAILALPGFAGDPVPPVLRTAEPVDNLFVTLPGAPAPAPRPAVVAPPPGTPAPRPVFVAPPTTAPALSKPLPLAPVAPLRPIASTVPKLSIAVEDQPPFLRRGPKPFLPPDFQSDSAVYCQKLIGAWTEADVYNFFGYPLRQRAAAGEEDAGHISAYVDPTGRYREIELDFAADTGLLRSVFVYPWKMTWQECRKAWGADVTTAEANNGRTFHSYANRRLDVLVDTSGNVVSLGLY